ncbi:hypothetical protein BC832DRAFT_543970 [Gaertneriomyces semiglobifer]|nr:hypothetical protein BC832DRAFT_543970 [Gaertneriomyces semiglobifer]
MRIAYKALLPLLVAGGTLAATADMTVTGNSDCTGLLPQGLPMKVGTMTLGECSKPHPDSNTYNQLKISDDVGTFSECMDSDCMLCMPFSCPVDECCELTTNVYFKISNERSSASGYAPSTALMALIGTMALALSL